MKNFSIASGQLEIKTVRLFAKQFAMRHSIDARLMEGGRWSSFVEEVAGHMVLQFQKAVASRIYDLKTVRFPADWWQAFKERFFPMWARVKWPVRFEEVTMEANAYHPDIQIPDHQTFVEICLRSEQKY